MKSLKNTNNLNKTILSCSTKIETEFNCKTETEIKQKQIKPK